MRHCQHEFCQKVSGPFSHDGDPQNPFTSWNRENLDKSRLRRVGNCPVKFTKLEAREFVGGLLFLGLLLAKADPSHLRIGEGAPGNGFIVGTKELDVAKKGVDGGIPGLMGSGMGKLVGSGHITTGIDIGEVGLELTVGLDRSILPKGDSEFLKAVSGGSGNASQGQEEGVEGKGPLL